MLVGRKGSIFRSWGTSQHSRGAGQHGGARSRGRHHALLCVSCPSAWPAGMWHRDKAQGPKARGAQGWSPPPPALLRLLGRACWPPYLLAFMPHGLSTLAGLLGEVQPLVQGVMPELLPPALCPLLSSAVAPEVTPGAAVVELCQPKMPLPRRTTEFGVSLQRQQLDRSGQLSSPLWRRFLVPPAEDLASFPAESTCFICIFFLSCRISLEVFHKDIFNK